MAPFVITRLPAPVYQFDTLPQDSKFKQKNVCVDKIKVELWYETSFATHIASRVMQASSAYEGPFVESVCVFLEPTKVFDMVEAYWDIFEELKDAHLVPSDAILQGFDILMEDQLIKAWVIEQF